MLYVQVTCFGQIKCLRANFNLIGQKDFILVTTLSFHNYKQGSHHSEKNIKILTKSLKKLVDQIIYSVVFCWLVLIRVDYENFSTGSVFMFFPIKLNRTKLEISPTFKFQQYKKEKSQHSNQAPKMVNHQQKKKSILFNQISKGICFFMLCALYFLNNRIV